MTPRIRLAYSGVLSEHSTKAAFQHWAAIAIGSYQHERRPSARDFGLELQLIVDWNISKPAFCN